MDEYDEKIKTNALFGGIEGINEAPEQFPGGANETHAQPDNDSGNSGNDKSHEDELPDEQFPDILSLSFVSRYDGWLKDAFFEKIRTSLRCLLYALVMMILAIYLITFTESLLLSYVLYFAAIFMVLAAFVIPFIDRKNCGLIGEIELDIFPDSLEYEVRGRQKHQFLRENAKLAYIKIEKRAILFGKKSYRCYRIPKFCLTQEQIDLFTRLRAKLYAPKKSQPPAPPTTDDGNNP